jgi:TPR repeat protein
MHYTVDVAASEDARDVRQFNRAAQLLMGGRVEDQEEAAALIRGVAERTGLAAAQYNMGKLYKDGIGVPLNLELAVVWYTKAAEQGLSCAQHNVGVSYEQHTEMVYYLFYEGHHRQDSLAGGVPQPRVRVNQ